MEVKSDIHDNREKLIHAAAGAMARCTEGAVMFPVDVAKTRLQFQSKHLTNVKSYSGVFSALYHISTEEGVKGLTRGMLPKFVYIIPAAAVSFLCYEEVVRAFRMHVAGTSKNTFWSVFLPVVGMMSARTLGSICRTPFDIVKQRMQIQGSLSKLQHKNSKQAFFYIWRTEGLGSLFSYAHVALLRDMPFSAIYFSTYELLKYVQLEFRQGQPLHPIHHFVSGGLSGLLATTVTIPLDVVKTKLQTQAALPPSDRIYRGVFHAFKDIAQKEGLAGLTRGLGARVLYLTPASAIVFSTYEQYKKVLSKIM